MADNGKFQNDDGFQPHGYQDDLDSDERRVDEITHELTDEPSDVTLVPNSKLRDDLDSMAVDETDESGQPNDEDMREEVEDFDEDPKDDR